MNYVCDMDTYNGDEEYEDEEERVASHNTEACVDAGLVKGEEDNGCKCKWLVHQCKNTRWMVTLHPSTLILKSKIGNHQHCQCNTAAEHSPFHSAVQTRHGAKTKNLT